MRLVARKFHFVFWTSKTIRKGTSAGCYLWYPFHQNKLILFYIFVHRTIISPSLLVHHSKWKTVRCHTLNVVPPRLAVFSWIQVTMYFLSKYQHSLWFYGWILSQFNSILDYKTFLRAYIQGFSKLYFFDCPCKVCLSSEARRDLLN